MQGRQLRLRVIKTEPGGVFGIHSHKDRPAVAFVMQGTLTEYREGGYVKEHGPGGTLSEGKDITHWAENKGTTPLVLTVMCRWPNPKRRLSDSASQASMTAS